ncbi:phosphatase PAP2 family protein [Halalkalibacter krulwichiae]|uniref:Phosphatidylglycerophosphatase B n=1 Tax=Halalkalibacter krulwichiae TaxID=199441 RepID=A0A1X9MAI1_9BACI|nr:phosphatase PAP2 family protein [Halalkalibacter krulwichiae]ARK30436.1 Phosphatidylglycerophosphatase B [Halalkalibacter krulwichiae]
MKHRLWWVFFVFCILPLAGFIAISFFVSNGQVSTIDQFVIDFVKRIESPSLTNAMVFVSHLGSTGPVIVLSCIVLAMIYLNYRKKDEVILFIIVSLGSTGINQALKILFKRDRPLEQIIMETGFSYPSGHTMAAVSLYGIVTFLFWRHIPSKIGRTVLICVSSFMILVIAFSRVYLRVHYASDIIGAVLLSGIWLYLSIWVYQYSKEKHHDKEVLKKESNPKRS